jgi:hypothetical protein
LQDPWIAPLPVVILSHRAFSLHEVNGKRSAVEGPAVAFCFSNDCRIGPYSVFDSALDRMHNATWLFPQEKATLPDVSDVSK